MELNYVLRITAFLLGVISLPLIGQMPKSCPENALIVKEFRDSREAVQNPGMGWSFPHFDNTLTLYGRPLGKSFTGSDFPGLTNIYFRIPWGDIEPKPGEYHWNLLDEVIKHYGEYNKTFGFSFTVLEQWPDEFGCPPWLRTAGAKGVWVDINNNGQLSWEPDYLDPIFLMYYTRFMQEAGKRYGRNPGLEYIDVASIGPWGEGNPLSKYYGMDMLRKHIQITRDAFPNKIVFARDDWYKKFRLDDPDGLDPIELAYKEGLGFRDDSILVFPKQNHEVSIGLANKFWPTRPVFLEMGHTRRMYRIPELGAEVPTLIELIEKYHASYILIHGFPSDFLKTYPSVVEKVNARLGYRLILKKIEHACLVKKGHDLTEIGRAHV